MRRPESFYPSANPTPSDDETRENLRRAFFESTLINVSNKIGKELKNLRSLIAIGLLLFSLNQSSRGSQLENEINKKVGISEPPCGTVLTIKGLKNPSELSIGGSKVKVEITDGGETFFYGSEKIRYGRLGPSVILEGTADEIKKSALLEADSFGSEVKIRITCDEDSKPNPTSETIPMPSDRSSNVLGPTPEPTSKETPSTKNEPSNPSTPTPEQQAPSSQAPSSVDGTRCVTIGEEVSTPYRAWMALGQPNEVIQVREGKEKVIGDPDKKGGPNLQEEIAKPDPFKGYRIGDKFCAKVNQNQK
jgi:hypothetical protein